MSDTVQLAVVAGIITIATLIIKAIIDSHAKRQDKKMEAVEIKIDGRLTQLLEMTKIAYKAEGKDEGKAEEKERHKIEVIETHTLPVAGTTNLKIVEGEIKVKTEKPKKP